MFAELRESSQSSTIVSRYVCVLVQTLTGTGLLLYPAPRCFDVFHDMFSFVCARNRGRPGQNCRERPLLFLSQPSTHVGVLDEGVMENMKSPLDETQSRRDEGGVEDLRSPLHETQSSRAAEYAVQRVEIVTFIRHILEQYRFGLQILSEFIQNADVRHPMVAADPFSRKGWSVLASLAPRPQDAERCAMACHAHGH